MHESLVTDGTATVFFIQREASVFYELEDDRPVSRAVAAESGCSCVQFKINGECIHTQTAGKPLKKLLIDSSTGETEDVNVPWSQGWAGILADEPVILPAVEDDYFTKLFNGHRFTRQNGSFAGIFNDFDDAFQHEKKLRYGSGAHRDSIPAPEWRLITGGLEWKDTPKPEGFYVSDEVWEALLWAGAHGENILLTGPSGSGKTSLAYLLSEAVDREIHPFNFGAMSEPRISLIGATHFSSEDGTWFTPSRFVNAFRAPGSLILLDEIARCERDAFNILFSAMDGQGLLYLDEDPDTPVIFRGEGVSFTATANIGAEYTGTGEIDRALLDRFPAKIELDFPPPDEEVILCRAAAPDVSGSFIEDLVGLCDIQRTKTRNDEFVEFISTRMVLDCVRMLQAGVSRRTALTFALFGCFSDEGGEGSDRNRCKLLFQRKNLL